MPRGLVFTGNVNWGLMPFWLGIHIEEYGCTGLGHHGLTFCLELGLLELMVSVGRRYVD